MGRRSSTFWTSVYQMPRGAFLFLSAAAHWTSCCELSTLKPKKEERGGLMMETSFFKKDPCRKRGEEL
jgi:hypothetical protein